MRYCEDKFEPVSATATIGIDFKVGVLGWKKQGSTKCWRTSQIKRLSVRGTPYRLTLFDTASHVSQSRAGDLLTPLAQAGQERFRTLSTSYYRGAHGVILVYDISNRASFTAMEKWFDEAEANTVPERVFYLVRPSPTPGGCFRTRSCANEGPMQVGAKVDKAETDRAVSVEEGRALAEQHGALFCEASAKSKENVRRLFLEVVDAIVQRPQLLKLGTRRTSGIDLQSEEKASSCISC
jgi:Ras-related protein Rab-18